MPFPPHQHATVRIRPLEGPFRRAIALRRHGADVCFGWIEDDFHHFGVRIDHRDNIITHVRAQTKRAPWSSCSGAALPLRMLEGQPLQERASDIGTLIDMRLQCTHLFDLAGLVMALAWRGDASRDYRVEVPNRPVSYDRGLASSHGATRVRLWRDGLPAMAWDIDESEIVGPAPYAGHSLNQGFRAWTESMPVNEAEQAFVLRRAIMVATGRGIDLDRVENAAQAPLPPVCHTFRGNLETALRRKASTRDFGTDPDALLSEPDIVPTTD